MCRLAGLGGPRKVITWSSDVAGGVYPVNKKLLLTSRRLGARMFGVELLGLEQMEELCRKRKK